MNVGGSIGRLSARLAAIERWGGASRSLAQGNLPIRDAAAHDNRGDERDVEVPCGSSARSGQRGGGDSVVDCRARRVDVAFGFKTATGQMSLFIINPTIGGFLVATKQAALTLPAAMLGFLRLSTRAGIFARPLPIEATLGVVDAWLHHPAAQVLGTTDRHAGVLARLLIGAGSGGSLVGDAHLAALAIEHNAEIATFDRDFARFAGLRWTLLK